MRQHSSRVLTHRFRDCVSDQFGVVDQVAAVFVLLGSTPMGGGASLYLGDVSLARKYPDYQIGAHEARVPAC